MTQLEHEIESIKVEVLSMWTLVESQLKKARTAMLNFDRDLAREVVLKEKRVNAFELKIPSIAKTHKQDVISMNFTLVLPLSRSRGKATSIIMNKQKF